MGPECVTLTHRDATRRLSVFFFTADGKISARCPVYRELQQLLGSAIGIPALPQLPSMYHVPHASTSTDAHSADLSLDPSLNVSGPSLVNTMHLPMAVVLGALPRLPPSRTKLTARWRLRAHLYQRPGLGRSSQALERGCWGRDCNYGRTRLDHSHCEEAKGRQARPSALDFSRSACTILIHLL